MRKTQTMRKTQLPYKEKDIFPLPGSGFSSRRQVISLAAFILLLLFSLPVGGIFVVGSERVAVWAKAAVLVILMSAALILIDGLFHFVFPKLRSSLRITIYDKGISMPVTFLEKHLQGKRPLVRIGDIKSIRIRKPKEWDSGDSLELLVFTRGRKVYRSSAKRRSTIRDIVEIISEKWPHIPIRMENDVLVKEAGIVAQRE